MEVLNLMFLKMLKYCVSFLIVLFIGGVGWAQEIQDNAVLVTNADHDHEHDHSHRPKYVFSGSKSALVKYNPVSLLFGGMLYSYQRFLSPQLSTRCSYETSCSNFGKQAILKYGLVKGIALAADRLTRCNQLAAYDFSETDLDHENQKILDDLDAYQVKR